MMPEAIKLISSKGGESRTKNLWFLLTLVLLSFTGACAQECSGYLEHDIAGRSRWIFSHGGLAQLASMNIDIDGYSRAYNPANYAAGAAEHICNAGRVYLPDGTHYEGSESNATCAGKFMTDFARIKSAGWKNGNVGAINWYGVLGQGETRVNGVIVHDVEPILQKDGSGFYVSPTALSDVTVADQADQIRYVDPTRVPFAVIPRAHYSNGVDIGTFGVTFNTRTNAAVPFVVADVGPSIGEGSVALARLLAGQPVTSAITRSNRDVGQVSSNDVLWVFFGGPAAKYDHTNPSQLIDAARQAYQRWGGISQVRACAAAVPRD